MMAHHLQDSGSLPPSILTLWLSCRTVCLPSLDLQVCNFLGTGPALPLPISLSLIPSLSQAHNSPHLHSSLVSHRERMAQVHHSRCPHLHPNTVRLTAASSSIDDDAWFSAIIRVISNDDSDDAEWSEFTGLVKGTDKWEGEYLLCFNSTKSYANTLLVRMRLSMGDNDFSSSLCLHT